LADAGAILISEDAFRHVRGKVEAAFSDQGEHPLKNIARAVRVYRIEAGSMPVGSPEPPALPRLSILVLPFAR
jgi:class 3 adenylate cyclase